MPYEKKKWQPNYKAEFSMGELIYIRLSKEQEAIDNASWQVGRGNYNYIKELYSLLRTFFGNLKPPLRRCKPALAENITKRLKEMNKKVVKAELLLLRDNTALATQQINNKEVGKIANELLELKDDIYDVPQQVGMGIVLERQSTDEERIKKAVEGE